MSADLAHLATAALVEELEQLRDAVRQLADPLTDDQIWTKPIDPGNSIGHLILHLTGNLNHFVGAQLGKTGYVRNREREFTEDRPPPRDRLFADLDAVVATFRRVVNGLTEQQLVAPHPEPRFGSVLKALIHLVNHFALHRGQMSYLIRLIKSAK
jgi:uncharacterized damage-inducible protein DinB